MLLEDYCGHKSIRKMSKIVRGPSQRLKTFQKMNFKRVSYDEITLEDLREVFYEWHSFQSPTMV